MRARALTAGIAGAAPTLVLLCGLLAGSPAFAADDRGSILGYARWAEDAVEGPPADVHLLDELAQRLADLAAERRREQAPDAPQLAPDPGLRLAAQAHALDMLERAYLDHLDPDGRDAGERVAILDRRFIGLTGENLAEHIGIAPDRLGEQIGPLAAKIADGWLSSPGHRENLLSPDYTHAGMAAAGRGERIVMVHVLGRQIARLREPVPLEVEQGSTLALAVEASEDGPAPQKYAFAPPGKDAGELVTLDLSSDEVVVDPGAYQLLFLVPTDDAERFRVAHGPMLVVKARAE